MARKPMSEEQKQHLRDLALARKEAKEEPTPIEDLAPGVESTQVPDATPAVDPAGDQQDDEETADEPGQVKPKDYTDHLANVQEARDENGAVQSRFPDMIEAKQAADALKNAIYFMGQVQNTLNSK